MLQFSACNLALCAAYTLAAFLDLLESRDEEEKGRGDRGCNEKRTNSSLVHCAGSLEEVESKVRRIHKASPRFYTSRVRSEC